MNPSRETQPQRPTPEAAPPESADNPSFGPGGYLPPRAAQRARKIVLRERMGMHWPIAAVAAGILILILLIPAVVLQSRAPEDPFVNAGPLDQIDPRSDGVIAVDSTTTDGAPAAIDVLVVRGGGVLVAFVDPPAMAHYCQSSRRIEDGEGNVWTLQGRRVGGTAPSLTPIGAMAFEDDLYLDIVRPAEAVASTGADIAPACA